MSSDNITPPQISEERIAQLWDAMPKAWPFPSETRASRAAFAQAVAAEINRQWMERLELAGWRIDWPDEPDLGFQFDEDPVPAHLGRSVALYSIKDTK